MGAMAGNKKTDNSNLDPKIRLRLDTVNAIEKDRVHVLECYSGFGVIWDAVKKLTPKQILVTAIEKRDIPGRIYLKGDNMKFLGSLPLEKYDIIDLDAYGIPFPQLYTVFGRIESGAGFRGFVHVTAIQTGMGQLPHDLLLTLGFGKDMIEQCPTLFNSNGQAKLEAYLYSEGVKEIKGYFFDRKSYFYFHI